MSTSRLRVRKGSARLLTPEPTAAPAPARRIVMTEPTVAELAANFAGAMERWSLAGFPTISPQTYAARSAACEPCDYWDGAARFGLGKCGAPDCGCTKFKRWLATETCKHPDGSRWPENPS